MLPFDKKPANHPPPHTHTIKSTTYMSYRRRRVVILAIAIIVVVAAIVMTVRLGGHHQTTTASAVGMSTTTAATATAAAAVKPPRNFRTATNYRRVSSRNRQATNNPVTLEDVVARLTSTAAKKDAATTPTVSVREIILPDAKITAAAIAAIGANVEPVAIINPGIAISSSSSSPRTDDDSNATTADCNVAIAFRILLTKSALDSAKPVKPPRLGCNIFGFTQTAMLCIENARIRNGDEIDIDGATASAVVPSAVFSLTPSIHYCPGPEDGRAFFRRGGGGGGGFTHSCRNNAYVSVNFAPPPLKGCNWKMAIIGPGGVHRAQKSPTERDIEKNWMPVIDRDGFIIERDGCGLFLYTFAASTFILVPLDPDGGTVTVIAATLAPDAPDTINDLHLCTPLVWSDPLDGYVCIFHPNRDWLRFAFAVFNGDGPNGAPGSRRGFTALASLPASSFCAETRARFEQPHCRDVFYPTSIAANAANGTLVVGIGAGDTAYAFAAIDPIANIHLKPGTGAPSPWN